MRKSVSSNSPYEATVGFSRAVRVGNQVFVAGTVGRGPDGNVVEGGVYEQARQALANIEAALGQLGALPRHVVRTRIYLVDIDKQDEVGRAHYEMFGNTRPASTMVEVSRLATNDMLVEIEADAVVD